MNFSGLLVGLGNPGDKYTNTRHNIGFLFIDYILQKTTAATPASAGSNSRKLCLLWSAQLTPDTLPWLLLKPQTFMNLSGEAVQAVCHFHKIPPQKVLVVHDELDLPLGKMKMKLGGGNAGHNGLRSIQSQLNTPDFYRLRIGIGKPPLPSGEKLNTTAWVLGTLQKMEQEAHQTAFNHAYTCLQNFNSAKPELTIQSINGY